MELTKVVLPPVLADGVGVPDLPGYAVVTWDGTLPVPAGGREAVLWVPSYPSAPAAETIRQALDELPSLRVVQVLSAGVDRWRELVPAEVTLCSGRSIHGGSTAELAVALTLAVVRDLPRYVGQQRNRTWEPHAAGTVVGRTVLVLGAGDIGGRVAAALGALDAEVVQVARQRRDGVVTMEEVPRLLPEVDVLVVALPHTEETTGVVDAALLSRLPDGAVVVNIARGAIVDTDALTAEVAAGRLRAGLDVTEPEPLPHDHPLWELPGVLITPHVGGGAAGWEDRAARLVRTQLQRLAAGEELLNVVSAGY
jgi:phosphoglycerate dehydrogenase-like enzyme